MSSEKEAALRVPGRARARQRAGHRLTPTRARLVSQGVRANR